MLIGNLRAQAVYVVIVAANADNARAEDLGPQDLGRLEVGGDKDACFEAPARGLRRDRVGQVPGGRTAHNLKAEVARLGQGYRDHAVLKAERREADGIVLEI